VIFPDTKKLAEELKARVAEHKPNTIKEWAETLLPGMWADEVTDDEVEMLLTEFKKWVVMGPA